MRPVPWVQNVQAFAYIRVLAPRKRRWHPTEQAVLLTAAFDRQLGLLDVRQPKQVQRAVTEAVETQSSSGWLFLLLQAALASLSGEAECAIWSRPSPRATRQKRPQIRVEDPRGTSLSSVSRAQTAEAVWLFKIVRVLGRMSGVTFLWPLRSLLLRCAEDRLQGALKLCVGGACDLESCQAKDQVLWTLMAHDVACTSIQDPQLYARASQNQELSSGHFPEILPATPSDEMADSDIFITS